MESLKRVSIDQVLTSDLSYFARYPSICILVLEIGEATFQNDTFPNNIDFLNLRMKLTIIIKSTAWKVSKYGVISGPYFPVFGLNTDQK